VFSAEMAVVAVVVVVAVVIVRLQRNRKHAISLLRMIANEFVKRLIELIG
jgi:hypothetical protein